MDRNTPILYWRDNDPRTTLEGTLEDLRRGDVYQFPGTTTQFKALADADIKEREVFVPSEDYTNILDAIFGEADYDPEGYLKFNHIDVELWKTGFEIRYSAKGFGFGGVSFSFSDGHLRTDTECTSEEILTSIFRAAAPALAKLALERDALYRKDYGLSSLEEDDAERAEAIKKKYEGI